MFTPKSKTKGRRAAPTPATITPNTAITSTNATSITGSFGLVSTAIASLKYILVLILTHLGQNLAHSQAILNQLSGLITINSSNHAAVWNYSKPNSLPLSIFPLPSTVPILATFIHLRLYTAFLAVNSIGLCRFWHNILDPDTFVELAIPFSSPPSFLIHCENYGVIIGLVSGELIRIKSESLVTNSTELTFSYILRPKNWLSLLSNSNSVLKSQNDFLIAAVPGSNDQSRISRYVYILTSKTLQKWSLFNNPETLDSEIDLSTLFYNHFGFNCKVLDLDYSKDDFVVLLVKSELRKSEYFLLVCKEVSDGLIIDFCKPIVHQYNDDSNVPCIALCNGGPFIYIAFNDLVMITNRQFEELIPFKTKDVIGFGVDKYRFGVLQDSKSKATICCASVGVLEVEFDSTKLSVSQYADPTHTFQTKQQETLSTNLEQYVFFGTALNNTFNNPIQFNLSNFQGDLNTPCIHLSKSILEATNPNLQHSLDGSASLSERAFRLRELVYILNDNKLIDQISESTLYRLFYDAEKIAVISALWKHHNTVLGMDSGNDLLTTVAAECTRNHDIRDFVYESVNDIPKLLMKVHGYVLPLKSRGVTLSDSQLVIESSRLFTIVFEAAIQFRVVEGAKYHIDTRHWLVEPFTAHTDLLDILQTQFEILAQVVGLVNASDDIDMGEDSVGLLIDLGKHLVQSFHDRMGYYQKINQNQTDIGKLSERYKVLLENHIVKSLVDNGVVSAAFELAEQFQELTILVNLSLTSKNPQIYIDRYIKKFGNGFATLLFQTYFDKQQYGHLMDQCGPASAYLDEFLDQPELAYLMWVQDLKMKRYGNASKGLWELAEKNRGIDNQQLIVSLSKLAYMQATPDYDSEAYLTTVSSFDIAQRFLLIQKHLKSLFNDYMQENHLTSQSLDTTVRKLMTAFYPNLKRKDVMYLFIQYYVKELVKGVKIPSKVCLELILGMDMQDNPYFDAWELWIEFSKYLPDGDMTAIEEEFYLNRIWRAAWLHDDWVSLHEQLSLLGDDEINTVIRTTNIFHFISQIHDLNEDHVIPTPSSIQLSLPPTFSQLYEPLTESQIKALGTVFKGEQDRLQGLVTESKLDTFHSHIIGLLRQDDVDMMELS
ncbi:hypothetical protein HDV02_005967 [Globomyces sp. JEL0801]|nr:hypothetical protein HDV02_005967 [Globomyces sp. JEL0801]